LKNRLSVRMSFARTARRSSLLARRRPSPPESADAEGEDTPSCGFLAWSFWFQACCFASICASPSLLLSRPPAQTMRSGQPFSSSPSLDSGRSSGLSLFFSDRQKRVSARRVALPSRKTARSAQHVMPNLICRHDGGRSGLTSIQVQTPAVSCRKGRRGLAGSLWL
jgi:hypothetical protein